MFEQQTKKELKKIKNKIPDGIDVTVLKSKIIISKKNKDIATIKFDDEYNLMLKTKKEVFVSE